MFCQIDKQNIKISLNPLDGSKCQEYVSYIESIMKSTAKNLIVIQGYIVSRQDLSYRQKIKQQKLAEIDKLQAIRLNIITNMKTFESNLLQKTIEYFLLRSAPYKAQIQKNYTALTSYTGTITTSLAQYKTLLSRQLETLTQIAKVKTVGELIPLMDTYVYLKSQLA
ncbi:MAG: hypothetical protein WCJ39_04220 [bacterium]